LTVEATKTLPPQITGVAPLGPGNARVQAIFCVELHEVGKSVSSVDPLKKGPRHWGQSVAKTGAQSVATTAIAKNVCFIRYAPLS
jgi:hypothetical protein